MRRQAFYYLNRKLFTFPAREKFFPSSEISAFTHMSVFMYLCARQTHVDTTSVTSECLVDKLFRHEKCFVNSHFQIVKSKHQKSILHRYSDASNPLELFCDSKSGHVRVFARAHARDSDGGLLDYPQCKKCCSWEVCLAIELLQCRCILLQYHPTLEYAVRQTHDLLRQTHDLLRPKHKHEYQAIPQSITTRTSAV